MKKIMFNDIYGLTKAVLSGWKTQTRRICKEQVWALSDIENAENGIFPFEFPQYKIGEVVAVSQSYRDAGCPPDKVFYFSIPGAYEYRCELAAEQKGWTNKMFVRAALMPHHIQITNVRVERLQDISDEDCIKEGVREVCVNNGWGNSASHWEFRITYEEISGRVKLLRGRTPQETYAALIDNILGKGVWERNPWVFAYEFKLFD